MNILSKRHAFLKLISLIVLAALVFPSAAFAEGETPEVPAEPAAPAESTTPAEQPVSEAQQVESSTEVAAPAETPALDAAPAESPVQTIVTEAPVADTAPLAELSAAADAAGTELVAADGAPLEMASQESADVLLDSDPYFTVGSVIYHFSEATGYCTANFPGDPNCHDGESNAIQGAINYIKNNGTIPTDRKIYVESGIYNGSVEINGALPNLNQLNGLIGVKTLTDLPEIRNSVTINNTILGFTLKGFNINGSLGGPLVYFTDNTGTLVLQDLAVKNLLGQGLYVKNHKGAVNATNVQSSKNRGYGALIDNSTLGIYAVTIANSSFDHNSSGNPSFGLKVITAGKVTLNSVTAQDNNGYGARLEPKGGVVINNSFFDWNYSNPDGSPAYGLYVDGNFTTNSISMNGVEAHDNEDSGVVLFTQGSVTIDSLKTWNNTNGLEIPDPASTVSISNSLFNGNDFTGLRVRSKSNVTLTTVETNNNGSYGADLDNCLSGMGTPCTATGYLKIIGSTPNTFTNNGSIGLFIKSGGAVTLTNFEASDNTLGGVEIKNDTIGSSGSVTVNATYVPVMGTWLNTTHDNGSTGLKIQSRGIISVDKVFSDSNTQRGFDISNFSATSAKTVTLKNSTATGNTGMGIQVTSLGTITLLETQAYENLSQGANLNNASGNAAISVTSATNARFDHNTAYGLNVVSKGAITLRNLNADSNPFGSNIDNQSTSRAAVMISGSDFSDSSSGVGLYIVSNGLVTLQNVTANNNASNGIFVGDRAYDIYVGSATLSGVTANNNHGGPGIEIYALGTIALSNITTNLDSANGLYIDNCRVVSGLCTGTGNITLSGTGSEFNDNGNNGLEAYSRGTITLSNFSASNNYNLGMYLENDRTNATGNISLFAASGKFNEVNGNKSNLGIEITSRGTISIARTIADGNSSGGATIGNSSAPTAKNITITDSSFSHNQNPGLYVESKGDVIIKGVEAVGNSRYNTTIVSGNTARDRMPESPYMWEEGKFESWWFSGSGTVNIQLRSSDFAPMVYLYDENDHLLAFDENSGSGIDAFISSFALPGAGTYRIEVASQDKGYGFYDLALDHAIGSITNDYDYIDGFNVDNRAGTADMSFSPSTTRGNTFSDNNNIGLHATSYGNLSLNSVNLSHNGKLGAFLTIDLAAPVSSTSPVKNISLTNVLADENQDSGVSAGASNGAITWNGGGANGNAFYGGYLVNNDAYAAKVITLSNVYFNGNHGDSGLTANSEGAITLTNVSASFNDGSNGVGVGASLDNCHWNGSACGGSGAVTITGEFLGLGFDSNKDYGISVVSNGIFKWLNSGADDNGDKGLYLQKNYPNNGASSVTIGGTSTNPATFSNNGGEGIYATSFGPFSISYVEAINNTEGLHIDNLGSLAPQKVSLSKIKAQDNTTNGIYLRAGASTISDILVTGNSQKGFYFENTVFSGQAVIINRSTFNNNTVNGLEIYNYGDITLNGVEASDNDYRGAWLRSNGSKVTVLSTLGASNFNRNFYNGLQISNAGAVSMSNLSVSNNSWRGILIQTSASLNISSAKVLSNRQEGILADITGNVTIANSSVSNNDPGRLGNVDGIYLSVTVPTSVVSITNSIVTANSGSGINLTTGITPVLTGTFYLGNDTNNSGDLNIKYH
jgi:hypothetical protein